ncbi:MAG: hypothetical protein Q4F66_12180 [Clostridium sp.]|nr:hypothetical protein [Clostridium sp.]
MTILDILNSKITSNSIEKKALQIIKETYMPSVNSNYMLVVDNMGHLMVRIPSVEKRDEFVYSPFTDYPYTLVMCMKIDEISNPEYYDYIKQTFMNEYKDKLQIFFKDTTVVDKLLEHLKNTRKHIDYITYSSAGLIILLGLILCIFNVSGISKHIMVIAIVISFLLSIYLQLNKENQIKKIIDGYISVVNTDWYNEQLKKQYVFFCNFIG